MFNQINIIGRLVNSPELLKSKTGKKYAKFTLAVNRINQQADYFPCIAYDEKILKAVTQPYIKKGILLLVVGRINTGSDGIFSVWITEFRFFNRAESEYLNFIDSQREEFEEDSRHKIKQYRENFDEEETLEEVFF